VTGRVVSSLRWLQPLALLTMLAALAGAPMAAEQPAHGTATPDLSQGSAPAAEPELREEPRIGETPGGHGTAQEHGADAADHGAEGQHGGGMPQLDASTFPSQIFWLVIAFVTLYYLMRRKALPRVAEILEARQERIAADLDRAARLREEAEQAQRQQEAVVAEAQARALEQLKAVQERVSAETAQRQAELDADLGRQLAEAEARIGAAREQALGELQSVAAEVAQAAVERLAGLKVSEAEAKAALGRVMAEAA
jgi:F-type H+-transporting ATPase subunit b